MKCKDFEFILPLYSDDALSEDELRPLSGHLVKCPLCRQKLADHQEIRNGLRAFPRPEHRAESLAALRAAIGSRLGAKSTSPLFQLVGDSRKWVDVWLMPYAVGSVATLVVGFTMLWIIVTGEVRPLQGLEADRGSASGNTILVPYLAPDYTDVELDLSPLEYASSRAPFSGESPSINPQGALIQLTRSMVRNEEQDDEVTVVADVYENGVAEIAEVVEPSSDGRAISELQKALGSDPRFAAFVPASFDHRSDTIRVVLKIQSVNVSTALP